MLKTKRNLLIILSCIIILGFSLFLSLYFVCNKKNVDTTHEHSYEEYIVSPTCIDSGYTFYTYISNT